MAKTANNKKGLIIGICAAVVVVVAIVVAIILIPKGENINDAYFVSDGNKYVLTVDGSSFADSGSTSTAITPLKSHAVYTYSGDTITGLKAYYEFADAATAKNAYEETYKNMSIDGYKNIALNGKYIVLTADPSQYEGVSASEVKQQLDFMETLNNMDFSGSSESESSEE